MEMTSIIHFSCILVVLCGRCISSSSVVSSCSGRGVEKWNKVGISGRLLSWLRSIVTVPHDGHVQSRLHDRVTGRFLEHYAYYNDGEIKENLQEEEKKLEESVVTVGRFVGARPVGQVWQWRSRKVRDGFLYGNVTVNGEMTGDLVTFLYPDLVTGLRGKFVKGEMLEAVEVAVTGERCRNGMKELKLRVKKKRQHISWTREDTNDTYIGMHTQQIDPYIRLVNYNKSYMPEKRFL